MGGKKLRWKVKAALASGLVVAVFGGSTAHAASIASQFFPGELNLLSDNSAEQLIDNNNSTPGILDVGDDVTVIFQIGTISDTTGGGGTNTLGAGGVNELTGLASFRVTGKVGLGAPIPGAAGPLGTCTNIVCFSYGVDPGFEALVEALPNTPGNVASGIIVALFEDSTPDFDRDTTILAGLDSATNGVYRGTLGLAGDGDELIISQNVSDDIAALGGVALGTNTGTTNIQLSILENFLGLEFGQVLAGVATSAASDGLIDINGSGNVNGILGSNTSWDFYDDFNFTLNPLPEPSSVALLGLGLLGAGALGRRRAKRRQV